MGRVERKQGSSKVIGEGQGSRAVVRTVQVSEQGSKVAAGGAGFKGSVTGWQEFLGEDMPAFQKLCLIL